MSENKFETLSSLIDGSLLSTDPSIENKTIDGMLKDEELSTSWQNYHLIGDVLRDEVPQSLQLDLSAQIADAIAQEATILSPNSASLSVAEDDVAEAITNHKDSLPESAKVIQAENRFKAKITQILKPAGQVAIAASAAVLMIVGVQHNTVDNLVITPSQIVQSVPLAGFANPVSFNYLSPTQADQAENSAVNKSLQNQIKNNEQLTNKQKIDEKIAQQRRLQALMHDHQQQVKLK